MERLQASQSILIHSIFLVCFLLIIHHSLANHQQNNVTSKGTTSMTTTLNKLVLKKLSLLDENTFIEESLFPENNFRCGHDSINLTKHFGFVKNPDYPKGSYKVPIVCRWNIVGVNPEDIITISIEELNIENPNDYSKHCTNSFDSRKECCNKNYLKISESSSANEQYFCGQLSNNKGPSANVYISNTNSISVTFNATTNRNSRFYFSYIITPKFSDNCFSNEFRCLNGKCIPRKWSCNRKNECGDGSDELQCNTPSMNYVKCGGNENGEYYHISKRCDHKFDCTNKADEYGCTYCDTNQFRCLSSPNKCINNTMLCNGVPDCHDLSDELDCLQYCPPQKIRCGSMSHCYDQKLHRCNKILECPNGADELNCFEHCQGKIMCASGDGCYDLEERCNGIVQCADYSDEKNCTLELCRPDKGSFLCTNGRCIPYIWTCDRSADCYDGSDEMRCLKNNVITAAIIGSLICGLLIVIAVSCGCKLVALRHLEQYRNSINTSSHAGPFINVDFPFPNPGDLDASLFRLEHSVLFREPPPSYASTMGGYHDVNGSNNSYAEQYRRYRRQQRCRRVLRRPQHRNNQQQQQNVSNNSNNHRESIRDSRLVNDAANNNNDSVSSSETTILSVVDHHYPTTDRNYSFHQIGDKKDSLSGSKPIDGHQQQIVLTNNNNSGNSSHHHHYNIHHNDEQFDDHHQTNVTSAIANNNNNNNNDNLNIELEPIVPLTNFDCDSQPLIR